MFKKNLLLLLLSAAAISVMSSAAVAQVLPPPDPGSGTTYVIKLGDFEGIGIETDEMFARFEAWKSATDKRNAAVQNFRDMIGRSPGWKIVYVHKDHEFPVVEEVEFWHEYWWRVVCQARAFIKIEYVGVPDPADDDLPPVPRDPMDR